MLPSLAARVWSRVSDPPSMSSYTAATFPLIRELDDLSLWRQLWFADDSSVIGDISVVKT